jgi:large subunit ribosomal protein L4
MASIPLRTLSGEEKGSVEVSDDVFAAPVNEPLVHQSVVQQLANQRLGTHDVKNRGEVRGGGAKPWRQKGTGRARQGSRTSPLWRGGGVVFGPHPRSYRQEMPKKMKRSALRSGLSSRHGEGAIMALDSFTLPEPKTRKMADAFKTLGLSGDVLIVDESWDDNAFLAARNIPDVELRDADSLNIIDVLGPEHLVFTVSALEALDRRLSYGSR